MLRKIFTKISIVSGAAAAIWIVACGPKPDQKEKYLSYYSQAHDFMEQNLPQKAIPLYKKAIKEKIDFSAAYHELAVCYQQLGNDSAAIANYEGAIVYNARDIDAYQSIGNIYYMKREFDQALTWYDKASDVEYLYPRSYNNMATIWYMRNNYEMAKKYWNLAVSVDATYPRSYYGLGLLAFITGDTTEAESKFLDAVKVGSMPEAIYMLGTLYFGKKDYDQSESWFNKYLEMEPGGEWANKSKDMLAIIAQKKGQK